MLKTVEAVKREREREHNSNELSLINYAQNIAVIKATIAVVIVTVVVVVNGKESTDSIDVNKKRLDKKINKIENHIKDGLYSNEKLLYSPSFLCV